MKNLCKVSGCVRPVYGHGYCGMHYQRWRKHGDPKTVKINQSLNGIVSKFIEIASNYTGDDCLIWPFGSNRRYGQFYKGGRHHSASHVVCENAHGPSPSIIHQAAHSCGNGLCVNPNHLRWATPKENSADKIKHGTRIIGERHPLSKLTASEILKIRSMKGKVTGKLLAKTLNVSDTLIYNIWARKTWSHVS